MARVTWGPIIIAKKLIFEAHRDRMEKQNQEQHTSFLTEREIKWMAAKLEHSNIFFSSYEEMTKALKDEQKQQIHTRPHQRKNRKALWNLGVDRAVERGKRACRKHRGILKRGGHIEVKKPWEAFRKCKQEAAACIQASIYDCGKRFMKELRSAKKKRPERFWRKLRNKAMTTVCSRVLI